MGGGETRMWVLRDLSVSAARLRAIFLIRPFVNRPRHCAIVTYYIYRTVHYRLVDYTA